MTKRKKATGNPYGTPQGEYFNIARKIWASVLAHLADFTPMKGMYTKTSALHVKR